MGTAIYVHNKITYDNIILNDPLFQISAIRLHLPDNKKITLCNLYNQPNQNYDLNLLPTMLSNIPQPVLLVGDFNAHHPLWDESTINADSNGNKIEQLIINSNYCCLNECEVPTYFSKSHGKFSSIDLSICSSSIVDCFEWDVTNDLYTSDHFPVIISYLSDNPKPQERKFNFSRADWNKYNILTKNIPTYQSETDHNETNAFITEFIINAANSSIPKTSNCHSKKPVSWWSDELTDLVKTKHILRNRIDRLNQRFEKIKFGFTMNGRDLQKLVIIAIQISQLKPELNKISAKFRRQVIRSRKNSWETYVSTLSGNVSDKEMWSKFRKITGNHIRPPRFPIIQNGTKIHDLRNISNIIGKYL